MGVDVFYLFASSVAALTARVCTHPSKYSFEDAVYCQVLFFNSCSWHHQDTIASRTRTWSWMADSGANLYITVIIPRVINYLVIFRPCVICLLDVLWDDQGVAGSTWCCVEPLDIGLRGWGGGRDFVYAHGSHEEPTADRIPCYGGVQFSEKDMANGRVTRILSRVLDGTCCLCTAHHGVFCHVWRVQAAVSPIIIVDHWRRRNSGRLAVERVHGVF